MTAQPRPAYRSRTQRKKIAHTLRQALATYARGLNDDNPDGVLLMIAELTNQLVRLEFGQGEKGPQESNSVRL